MSVNVSDVRLWIVWRGVGHAVVTKDPDSSLTYRTACGQWGNFVGGQETCHVPSRICTMCRGELPNLKRAT